MDEWNRPRFRLIKREIAMRVRDLAEHTAGDRWRRQLPEECEIVRGLRHQSCAGPGSRTEPSVLRSIGIHDISLSGFACVPGVSATDAGAYFDHRVLDASECPLYRKHHHDLATRRRIARLTRRHFTGGSHEHGVNPKRVFAWQTARRTLARDG